MKKTFVWILILAVILVACAPQATPTPTPRPPTATPEATAEAAEATPEMTAEATPEMTAEATPEMTAEATPEMTAEAAEVTPEMTAEATPEMTAEATPEMTAEAAEATPEMTAEAAEATPEMTAEATPEMTAEATPEMTAEATAEVAAAPTVTPEATAETEMTVEAETTPETAAVGDFEGIKTSWRCPAGFEGQRLSVYNWSTYVAPDTISNFERLCGVTVTVDIFPSAEAALARLRQGNPGYDIVVPSDFTIYAMIDEELLLPLDLSRIPNFANLSESLKNPPYDPGNQYTIPYQWGTVGVGYDFNKVGEEITSWRQVFDYDGPVAWLDDPRSTIGVGLKMLGFDPNSSNADEVNQAKDFMIENGRNVTYIAGDDGQELLARGEVNIAVEYSGDIFQIIAACEEDPTCTADFRYVIPEEGANIWTDNLVIPVGARNPDLAHVFIDYILDPQVGADISNFTAYATPNQASIDQGLIDAALLENPAIYPTDEKRQRLFFIVPDLATEQIYNDAWDEIKIALGR